MSTALDNLKANLELYKYDLIGIQRSVNNVLLDATNGAIDIVDPTNPVALCLETAATLFASNITENEVLNRKLYPAAAQTEEELYIHMSDKDFVDRFAVPSSAKFLFMVEKDQLLSSLVLEASTGIKKITIPRNTTVTVADTTFSLQYPVEIRQMAHGGLQVVYIADIVSPLQTLSTNIVSWQYLSSGSANYLAFELEMSQFDIVTQTVNITSTSLMTTSIDITDQYYYCRVYVVNGDGTYTEVVTTHTDEVYDAAAITAVLKVVDQTLTVKIPQIYVDSGLLNKSIRVDMYQTKGDLTLNLSSYTNDQFVANWLAINTLEIDDFVKPLQTFRDIGVASRSITSGGASGLTFAALRDRVQKGIGQQSLPITNTQAESSLNRDGYQIVKNIDVITNRTFLATRSMPVPSDSDLLTSASAGIGTLSVKASEAVTIGTVVDNGNQITLTPDTVYHLNNGVLELVSTSEVNFIKNLPVDQQATVVTNGNYLYSPFHYVLDSQNNEFDLRAYYLDNPAITSKSFVGENDTTLLQVSTGAATLVRTPTGYKLTVVTSSSDGYKALADGDCQVQLAYIPTGDTEYAYLNGTYVGRSADTLNERMFEFALGINYAMSATDELSFTSFTQFNTTPRVLQGRLSATYDILYTTSANVGNQWVLSTIDSLLGNYDLPNTAKAITHEQIVLHLGDALKALWSRARSVVSENQYERWTMDVPAKYSVDVYQPDPVTGASFNIVNGALVYNILHHAGDVVHDGNGNVVYQYRVGDVKLDAYGNPIVVSSREMLRQLDLMLIEGTYHFATDAISGQYRQDMVVQVVDWITEDLPTMDQELLENTEIYFYPVNTIGNVKVIVDNGTKVTLNAGQYFKLRLTVRDAVYKNTDVRDTITTKSVSTISQALNTAIVAHSDIVDALRTQYGSDVIGIDLQGLGGDNNYDVIMMTNDSDRLSLRKRLVAGSDESLRLEEDVSVEFINIDASKSAT